MKKERVALISIISGLVILAGAFFIQKALAGMAQTPERKSRTAVKGVIVAEADPDQRAFELPVYGKLKAFHRIELYAEVTGVLQRTNPAFLEGTQFKEGQTLLRIEDSEAKAALMSQRSNYINTLTQVLPDLKLDYPHVFDEWQAYLASIDVDRSTPAPPSVDNAQVKIFLTSRGVFSAYHNLKSTEERLSKYHIRAPFNGVVTSSSIRPGTLVRVGQPLGVFIDPSLFEMEVSVSIRFLDFLEPGDTVRLESPDIEGEWLGIVDRINKGLDANSQTVKAYIDVRGNRLREGMYLNGVVSGVKLDNVEIIPRRLLVDNDHLWTVDQTDSTLIKKPIEIVEYTESNVLIRGLEEGEWYLSQVAPGVFQGMKVTVSKR